MLHAERYRYQTNRFLGSHMEEIALNSPFVARVCAIPFGLATATNYTFFAQIQLTERIARLILGEPPVRQNQDTLFETAVHAISSPVTGLTAGLLLGASVMVSPVEEIKHFNAQNEATAFLFQKDYPDLSVEDAKRGVIVNKKSFLAQAIDDYQKKIWDAKNSEEVKKLHFLKTLKDRQNLEREIEVKNYLVRDVKAAFEKKEISLEKFTCKQKEIAQKLMSEAEIIEVERQMHHRIATPLDPIHLYRALRAR